MNASALFALARVALVEALRTGVRQQAGVREPQPPTDSL